MFAIISCVSIVDVISHGGDGAGDPPQQPSHRLASACECYFNLQGDRSPNEYRMVCAAVDRLAANRYHDYKLKVYNHLKAHGPSRPYDKISTEDWQKCIDFFTSPTFVDKLVELRETQHTQVASNGAWLDDVLLQRRFSENDEVTFVWLDGFRKAPLPP
ncbi:hypothetical protein Adt_12325 [Abeliophyllum distichum]|uniref:Uncharacterized protein n=1 Tax=Abeliophyllum distichum TaxID=126358 RepID=A0ABD1UQN5_9LAMI